MAFQGRRLTRSRWAVEETHVDSEPTPERYQELLRSREFRAVLEELHNESDRAAAILGAAFLDESLHQLLLSAVTGGPRVAARLLDRDRPLSTFGARVLSAYAFGLISQDEFDELEIIRTIRNAFAHREHSLSFSTQSISDRAARLNSGRLLLEGLQDLPITPRKIFDTSVAVLAMLLGYRHLFCKRVHTPSSYLDPKPIEQQ